MAPPIYNPLDPIQGYFEERLADLRGLFEDLIAPVVDGVNLLKDLAQSGYGAIAEEVGDLVAEARDIITSEVSGITSHVTGLGNIALGLPSEIIEGVESLIEDSARGLKGEIQNTLGGVDDVIRYGLAEIGGVGATITGEIRDEFRSYYELLVDGLSELLAPVGTFINEYAPRLEEIPGAFGEGIAAVLKSYFGAAGEVQAWLLKVLIEVATVIAQIAGEFAQPIFEELKVYADKLITTIGEAFSIEEGDTEAMFQKSAELVQSALASAIPGAQVGGE